MTLKLSDTERKIYRAQKLQTNMKNYYENHREEHKEKCRKAVLSKYENDPEYRRKCIDRAKSRQLLKKEFKILCCIDFF